MVWEDNFKEGKELVLATCSTSGKPNANIVISLGFIENRLLVADCQMETTLKNLKENPQICVVAGYFKVCGSVEIFSSGKYFEEGSKIVASQDDSLKVKNVISINIESVFDLENAKKIV